MSARYWFDLNYDAITGLHWDPAPACSKIDPTINERVRGCCIIIPLSVNIPETALTGAARVSFGLVARTPVQETVKDILKKCGNRTRPLSRDQAHENNAKAMHMAHFGACRPPQHTIFACISAQPFASNACMQRTSSPHFCGLSEWVKIEVPPSSAGFYTYASVGTDVLVG